jgi:ATP-dependent Clp protease ATP-binding subunit ClpC
MERHNVSRLVGAPPGYVGYEEAGQLTEALRRRPYSIVVFDEIEKAHPEAHNMLLQIMEEGQLSDARGRKVDFRTALIVMTSNVGADVIKRQTSLGFSIQRDEETEERKAYEEMRKKLTDSLRRIFRPEFINRLDAVIVFRALNKEDLHEIVSLEIEKVSRRVKDYNITLVTTPAAVDLLAELGYDPDMGARPLRRVIQQKVEDLISDDLLSSRFEAGDVIEIDVEIAEEDVKRIVLRRKEAEEEEASEALALG